MMIFELIIEPPVLSEKLGLELEIEKALAKEYVTPYDLISGSLLSYAENFSLEEISSQVIRLALKRLLLLIRNKGIDQRHATELFIQETFSPDEQQQSLGLNLDKNRAAAYRRLLNSARGVYIAAGRSKKDTRSTTLKIILCGALQVYRGDQSFYSKAINSATEAASKGGLARAEVYRPTKEKICSMLVEMEPKDGWKSRAEAYKSILPGVKRYLADNNIKKPSIYSIENTLRDWLRSDPLVSRAVRVAD